MVGEKLDSNVGYKGNPTQIKNLTMSHAQVNGAYHAGALVGTILGQTLLSSEWSR